MVAAARRRDRLDALAASAPNIRAVTLDVTSPSSVAALAESLDDVALLVNNAGGAVGIDPVEVGGSAGGGRELKKKKANKFILTNKQT